MSVIPFRIRASPAPPLLKTHGQELGIAGVMVHTYELSAESSEWEGVDEILALII